MFMRMVKRLSATVAPRSNAECDQALRSDEGKIGLSMDSAL